MKINLSEINKENFYVDPVTVAGETCYLIHPRPTFFDWCPDTLHLRSSVWNSEGEPVSLGFRKFFNLLEKPHIEPFNSPHRVTAVEKLDGSLLIVSRYKGETIIRTRGTIDATKHDNGNDIELFKRTSLKILLEKLEEVATDNKSYLFEWYSPSNKIVLNYGDTPRLTLLNIVDHIEYKLWHSITLGVMAHKLQVPIPEVYEFCKLEDLLKEVPAWVNREGVCIYYNDRQSIRKVKSEHYLKLHAFKSLLTPKAIGTILAEWDPSNKEAFLNMVEEKFDFECREACKPVTDKIWPIWEDFVNQLGNVGRWAKFQESFSQKEFAENVKGKLAPHLHQYAFQFRLGKEVRKESILKTYLNLISEVE